MREQKFRVWDKVDKRYYNNVDIEDIGRVLYLLNDYGHEYIIEQYTGLKDKNGKGIYEGDIVLDDDFGDVGMVEYYAPNFTFHPIYPIERWNSHYIGMYMKVIGNIHENPELLGEEK